MRQVWWATNRWVAALGVLVAVMPVAGLLAAGPAPVALAFVLPVASIVVLGALGMACMRVVLGPDGLRVGAGPWAWPIRSVAETEILAARAGRREAEALGTVGCHDRPGHEVIMVRGGECLILELDGGRSLTLAVDGAAAAADVINARLAAAGERERRSRGRARSSSPIGGV